MSKPKKKISGASLRHAFEEIIWPRKNLVAVGLFLVLLNRLSGLVLPAAVKYLIEKLGVDPDLRDKDGYTAMHNSAARGDNETILYLISRGADVNLISRKGQTTADLANSPEQRAQPHPATIALLEKLGSENSHQCRSCGGASR